MLAERPRGAVSENRKVTKSAMEKKRRARINTSLVELKTILGGMLTHKTERFDKMEKADILEMTVRYVKQLQRKSEQLTSSTKPKDEDYKNGVNSCISEVIKYIASSNSCDDEIKAKLLDHLANRLTGVDENNMRHECKTALSTHDTRETESPETVRTESPNKSNSVQTPIHITTPSVCPTAITLSPGSNLNQLNLQGQLAATPLQTSPVMNTFQQTSPLMSNIPLTIIVPANLYPSVSGTACVIPLSIPTTGTTQMLVSSDPSSNVSNSVSLVATEQGNSCRTAIFAQQQTHCLNNNFVKANADANPEALNRESLVSTTDKLCVREQSTILKENVAFQTQNSPPIQHIPVNIGLQKKQSQTEQIWRPF